MRMRDMADADDVRRVRTSRRWSTGSRRTGLAERRTEPHRPTGEGDRPHAGGRARRVELHRALSTPPPVVERLSEADRRTLARLLAKMMPDDEVTGDPFRFVPPCS